MPRIKALLMKNRFENARILMYSHDTFGLGHLRRCRTIAHSLVQDYRGLMVLIISAVRSPGRSTTAPASIS